MYLYVKRYSILRTSRNVHIQLMDTSSSETFFVSGEASRRLTNIISMPNFFNSASIDIGGTLQPIKVWGPIFTFLLHSLLLLFLSLLFLLIPLLISFNSPHLLCSLHTFLPSSILSLFLPSLHPSLALRASLFIFSSLSYRTLICQISLDVLVAFP